MCSRAAVVGAIVRKSMVDRRQSTGSSRLVSASASTSWRIESAFNRLKDLRRIATATIGWHETIWPLSVSPQPLYGGFDESNLGNVVIRPQSGARTSLVLCLATRISAIGSDFLAVEQKPNSTLWIVA